jgi:hypothetical protein
LKLLLLLLKFHIFPEAVMVEWLFASLTEEVSISKSHVNLLTNHTRLCEMEKQCNNSQINKKNTS